MQLLLHPSHSGYGMSNHRAQDAAEHAAHHVEGLTIESKARPQHHCLPVQLASSIAIHSLPPLVPYVLLNWFTLT